MNSFITLTPGCRTRSRRSCRSAPPCCPEIGRRWPRPRKRQTPTRSRRTGRCGSTGTTPSTNLLGRTGRQNHPEKNDSLDKRASLV